MNLAIDIGNTRVKTGIFDNNILLYKESISLKYFSKSLSGIVDEFEVTNTIISSVGKANDEINELLRNCSTVLKLTQETKVPFINNYKTPQSLGVDRIALMAAAINQYPKKNVLVIDAGSCITYDFVNDKNEYFGGAISPGIEMRYKSLNAYTMSLPNLSLIEEIPKVGNSTQNAIHIGILNGVIQEIEGVIDQFKAKNKKLTVVLTGGDTIFLARNIKSTIFANPNFLLEGLNSILIYNKDV